MANVLVLDFQSSLFWDCDCACLSVRVCVLSQTKRNLIALQQQALIQ